MDDTFPILQNEERPDAYMLLPTVTQGSYMKCLSKSPIKHKRYVMRIYLLSDLNDDLSGSSVLYDQNDFKFLWFIK